MDVLDHPDNNIEHPDPGPGSSEEDRSANYDRGKIFIRLNKAIDNLSGDPQYRTRKGSYDTTQISNQFRGN